MNWLQAEIEHRLACGPPLPFEILRELKPQEKNMKAATHLAGVIEVKCLNFKLALNEDSPYYKAIKTVVLGHGPLFVVCKGALFVMPWHQVKTEFERIVNWHKVEHPYTSYPTFNVSVNLRPLGNAELLTDLYAGTEDLDQTKPVKP
jgi:hypothetical protein